MNPFVREVGHGFRRVGRVVIHPARVAKRKAQMAILLGVLRHVITAAGGALVAQGYVSTAQNTELVGAVLTILGVVASIAAKKRSA